MSKKKEKRYFFSVVEEGVLNPAYKGYCGGRVEVYDNKDKSGFASAEYRFFLPEEFMYGFRELFDFKESDKPISIRFDMSDKKRTNKNNGQFERNLHIM